MKIAVLASANMMPGHPEERADAFERDEEMGKLIPAFAEQGMALDLIEWRSASVKAADYDAMLPLLVWDYFEGNEAAFLSEMKAASKATLVFNTVETLNWNADKSYLDELARRGAPVIETINVERITEANVDAAFETLGTNKLVIKPQVGGGAWRQVLHTQGDKFPSSRVLPPGAAMIQAFLPSVQSEGEYSFLYFGGEYSHGLIKRPKDGDYRIQSLYGGTEETYAASEDEKKAAEAVLATMDVMPLYARVDLLRGLDGQLKLIELEMIEPYLYLGHSEGEGANNVGAQNLARALKRYVG